MYVYIVCIYIYICVCVCKIGLHRCVMVRVVYIIYTH